MLILWFAVLLMAGCAEHQNSYEYSAAQKVRCAFNEIPVKCKIVCPPESCDIAYTEYACGKQTCEPGCACLPNHLRNKSGICIPNEECPPPPTISICDIEQNEILSRCKIVCPPQTCESIYTLYSCIEDIPCEWGCDCVPGYLRNSSGTCIPSEKCPTSGNSCGPNGIFVPCKYTCQSSYCPKNNSRDVAICKPPHPSECCSGCICKLNYRLLSREEPRCIRADYCPPLKCPHNERWDRCPNECNSGYCEDVDKPPVPCNSFVLNCNPRCTCKDNFFRDRNTGLCVSSAECREINKNEECNDD